jgi:L-ascorbate metabolism protein UlaG (beta-lactamase superfamily)
LAARLLGVKTVIPAHFGTFPILVGRPADLEAALAAAGTKAKVWALTPGVPVQW